MSIFAVQHISVRVRLMRGSLQILTQQQGLTQHANYHEICRLLARLKANNILYIYIDVCMCTSSYISIHVFVHAQANYQLSELVDTHTHTYIYIYVYPCVFVYAQANYQLSELVASDCYAEWIAIVATFTIDSFNHWQEHTYICTHV